METTTESNKLIAEFMGVELQPPIAVVETDYEYAKRVAEIESQPTYHNSWDWLMPVIAKLVDDFGNGWKFEEGYDLDVRYQYVVKFIEEHNVQIEEHNVQGKNV